MTGDLMIVAGVLVIAAAFGLVHLLLGGRS